MIYLAANIFIYLLLALALGAAAGWLWRNQQAAMREAAAERAIMDARARVPQMEATARAQDQRFEALRLEYNKREEELAARTETLNERDRTVAELTRQCAQLQHELETRAAPPTAPEPEDDVRRDLEDALTASREELERLQRSLTAERRRVEELTQERELQRASLAALEQQLELAREGQSRAANG